MGSLRYHAKVSQESAIVSIQVLADNPTPASVNLELRNEIYTLDGKGKRSSEPVVATKPYDFRIPSSRDTLATSEVPVPKPRLWSPKEPNLYLAVTSLIQDGKVIDRVETTFGIRSIEIDAARGFVLNGEPLRISGGVHASRPRRARVGHQLSRH